MIFGMCDCERSPPRGKAFLLLAVALLACTNEFEQRPPPPTLAEHEAEVIPAVVRHFRATGQAGPSGNWFIEDRLIVDNPHGPVSIDPRSYRRRELPGQLRARIAEAGFRTCRVQDGVVCPEVLHAEFPATVVAIGAAEDQTECEFPWWVYLVYLRRPEMGEQYAAEVFLACLEQDGGGRWTVADMERRWTEN